jgi:release factor glutamine methyltransferase
MPLPLLLDLVKRSADYLVAHGIANGRREAEWIFCEALGLARIDLYTRFDMPLDDAEVARLRALVQRRGRREPLAYVLGNQEFCGLKLAVTPAVLVPRPETEELVALVLADEPRPAVRLLDVGTGSGALALAFAHARPGWSVAATDVSPAALALAGANAARLGLAVAFSQGDLAGHLAGPFELIVANLPYVGEDERGECDPELAFEPALALFAGADGMECMRRLIADAPRLLAPGGRLWLEHGWRQREPLAAACARHGLVATTSADLAGRDRFTRIARPDGA